MTTPSYYKGAKFEVKDFIRDFLDLDWNLGNVAKYIARAGKKPGASRLSDLKKARDYLDEAIRLEEPGENETLNPFEALAALH